MAGTIYLNSLNDYTSNNNQNRLLLLSILLACMGFFVYGGQLQKSIYQEQALDECYQYLKLHNNGDTELCDRMSSIMDVQGSDYEY